MKINWQTVAVGVFGLLLSVVVWNFNHALGRLEAAESEAAEARVREAQFHEIVMSLRADLQIVKADVKELLRAK